MEASLMLPTLFDNTTIPALQEVVGFTQARHNVLVGNIANADTPGYRVRDLSVDTFQDRLKEFIAARRGGRTQVNSPGSPYRSEPQDEIREVRESLKSIEFLDQSNVGIEQQVTEVAKNHSLHNVSVAIMKSQFRLLQTAISERV
ncbi:MAG: flagellar basal body rod protein FlgB [Pirellulaceae bacterium]